MIWNLALDLYKEQQEETQADKYLFWIDNPT